MAGGEVHVSFAASSQTHSVQPIMPNLATRAKMSLSRAQNMFMPTNINSIVLLFLNGFLDFLSVTGTSFDN